VALLLSREKIRWFGCKDVNLGFLKTQKKLKQFQRIKVFKHCGGKSNCFRMLALVSASNNFMKIMPMLFCGLKKRKFRLHLFIFMLIFDLLGIANVFEMMSMESQNNVTDVIN
jgi:hypothetical protein